MPTTLTTAAVQRLWDRMRSSAGHHLVLAPSGLGKSSLLRIVSELSEQQGTSVTNDPTGSLVADELLLLDDAHRLPVDEIQRLLARADEAGASVVLAARPEPEWRRQVLEGRESAPDLEVTTLEPWTADDVLVVGAAHAAPGAAPLAPDTAARLTAQTGGLPWLVAAEFGGDVKGAVLHRIHSLGAEAHDVLVALACGRAGGDAVGVDRLIAAGLIPRGGSLPLAIRRVVVRNSPQQLVASHLAATLDMVGDCLDEDLVELADELVRGGMRDPRLASLIERSADATLEREPDLSADRYRLAIEAGGEIRGLTLKRSEAQGLSGDVAGALATLESVDPQASTAYLRVATTLAILDRQPDRAAHLWRWAATEDLTTVGSIPRAIGAYALLGVGDPDGAGELVAAAPPAPPSTLGSVTQRLAEGISSSLVGDGRSSLPSLIDAATVTTGQRNKVLLPDHPAAVAALLCLGSGDVAMADSLLAQASSDASLNLTDRSRVSALRAWVAMMSSRYADAEQHLLGVDPAVRRDEPWLRAIRIGLARRRDDLPELTRLWAAGRGGLLSHPDDLYAVLPLGELGLAGARMHDHAIVDETWGRASSMLARLDNPPAWSAAFHWYGVQAAILRESPKALAPHATALVAAARKSTYAGRLADAARVWVAALGGRTNVVEVDSAARELAKVGQAWEGARLAAHAAARAGSKRDSALLMECARDLRPDLSPTESGAARGAVTRAAPGGPAGDSTRGPAAPGRIDLTPREQEVVELVLAGLTYREIGARLFLSAKTVEHHMARIKRRSDATTRGELLRQLASSLHGEDD